MISGKFAITLHILTLMVKMPDEFLSSDFIAGSLNANPVLVRKEIANLKKHGIVESREGKNGGTRLVKKPESITLQDVFAMTFEKIDLGFSKNTPNPNCPVGKNINLSLEQLYADINLTVVNQLGTKSLAEFASTL
jgi:DNA-binding IscR family transcriptional regulator